MSTVSTWTKMVAVLPEMKDCNFNWDPPKKERKKEEEAEIDQGLTES